MTAIALILAAASYTPSYPGDVLQDTWEVVSDPIGLSRSSKELSDSVQRTIIQLNQFEGVANSHVKERLEQIRSILHDAIGGTDEAIKKAMAAMRDIERQVNIDAVNLIYTAKCVADVLLMNSAQKSFAGFVSTLAKADPSLTLFGIKIIDLSTNNVEITDPDKAYISTSTAALSKLKKDTSDLSRAYNILSTYQNLEIAAKFVRCYYKDQAFEAFYTKEVNELERLSLPWTVILEPDINYRP